MFRIFQRTLILISILMFQPNLVYSQVLYLDKQFDFTRTSEKFASKPVFGPGNSIGGNIDLYLELFTPDGPNVPFKNPLMILIHGGGFKSGTRFSQDLIEICEDMAQRGWVCTSIDYRLLGDLPIIGDEITNTEWWPTLLPPTEEEIGVTAASEDALAAYRWLIMNSDSLSIDTEKIVIGGSSAGSATAINVGYFLDDLGLLQKNDIDAVYDRWGSLVLDTDFIQEDDPPIFIVHGDADTTKPVSEAFNIRDKVEGENVLYEMHIVPGAGHGFDVFTTLSDDGEPLHEHFLNFLYINVINEQPEAQNLPMLNNIGLLALGLSMLGLGAVRLRKK